MSPLSLGFSPCPNDTLIFYALVHNKIDLGTLDFAAPVLRDVEQLNSWAQQKKLDVTKLSFHALGHVLDEYCVLSAGSALGKGCGPLLIARPGISADDLRGKKIAIPGKLTTAALLFRMFMPECEHLVQMRFDHIMEAIKSGEVDAGVIIHESRFTYEQQGFVALQDLGEWWETKTEMPIPLGCIAARRSLGSEKIRLIDQAIKESVTRGLANPVDCMPYIQQNSQELAPDVVQEHIKLYVNDFSKKLGAEGRAAIETFLELGRKAGVLPENNKSLMVSEL